MEPSAGLCCSSLLLRYPSKGATVLGLALHFGKLLAEPGLLLSGLSGLEEAFKTTDVAF